MHGSGKFKLEFGGNVIEKPFGGSSQNVNRFDFSNEVNELISITLIGSKIEFKLSIEDF